VLAIVEWIGWFPEHTSTAIGSVSSETIHDSVTLGTCAQAPRHRESGASRLSAHGPRDRAPRHAERDLAPERITDQWLKPSSQEVT
jgi:hypothetical protein